MAKRRRLSLEVKNVLEIQWGEVKIRIFTAGGHRRIELLLPYKIKIRLKERNGKVRIYEE